jgi:hypothetical protein
MFLGRIGARETLLAVALSGGLGALNARADQPPGFAPAPSEADRHEAESLDSPAWRHTLRAWNEWLAADKSYSPGEVERLKQELDAQLSGMSSSQLADFKSDLDAKLTLLTGQAGRDYRLWENETLSVASDAYARKVRAHLPDFAHMTASEVQAVLDRFEYERYRAQQSEAAYHRSQERRATLVREELQYQREAWQRSLDRAGRNNLQAHFAVPPQHQANFRHYRSQTGYGFGYGWGFGFGLGFW